MTSLCPGQLGRCSLAPATSSDQPFHPAQGDRGKISQVVTNLLLHAMKSSDGAPVEVRALIDAAAEANSGSVSSLAGAAAASVSGDLPRFPLAIAVQYGAPPGRRLCRPRLPALPAFRLAAGPDAATPVSLHPTAGGRPLSPADAEALFTSYDSPGTLKGAASGHWLFVSRQIARAMGGDITADSGGGRGTRLVLRLPLEVEESSAASLARATSEGGALSDAGAEPRPRRFPAPSTSSCDDLHVRQPAGRWVAKPAAAAAGSGGARVGWLGIEDLAQEAAGSPSATAGAASPPMPGGVPVPAPAAVQSPEAGQILWRDDSAHLGIRLGPKGGVSPATAASPAAAASRPSDDDAASDGPDWADGDMPHPLLLPTEHDESDDYPSDSARDLAGPSPLEISPPGSPRPASAAGGPPPESPSTPAFTRQYPASSSSSRHAVVSRRASASLVPIEALVRGGGSGGVRDSAFEDQYLSPRTGGGSGSARSLRSPRGASSPRHPVHPHHQAAQPVPILPSSCSAVSVFRMAMEGRARGPEAKALFSAFSASRGSLSHAGSSHQLSRAGGASGRSTSDFGSASSFGTDRAAEEAPGFWTDGIGGGGGGAVSAAATRRYASDTSAGFGEPIGFAHTLHCREASDPGPGTPVDAGEASAAVAVKLAPAGPAVGGGPAGASYPSSIFWVHPQLATWAEAGPPQRASEDGCDGGGARPTASPSASSLLDDRPKPIGPVSSLSVLLRRASSSSDGITTAATTTTTNTLASVSTLPRGSQDGCRSEGQRHSDAGGEALSFHVPPASQLSESPAIDRLYLRPPLPPLPPLPPTPSSALPPSPGGSWPALSSSPARPISIRSPTKQQQQQQPPSAAASTGSLGRLLYVEDHHLIRVLVSRVLEKSGFEVVVAVDGAEGLRMLTDPSLHLDVCITDLDMPVMCGDKMVAQYREWCATVVGDARSRCVSGKL